MPIAEQNYTSSQLVSEINVHATGQQEIEQAGAVVTSVGGIIASVASETVIGTVIGAVVAAVGAVIGLAGKLFGSKWHLDTDVRWLIQAYQYYVQAEPGVTSDNKVDETQLNNTLMWMCTALGVAITKRTHLNALQGVSQATGRPDPTQTYTDRANAYLSFPEAAGIDFQQAITAAQCCDQFPYFNAAGHAVAGSWANQPPASYWFNLASAAEVAQQQSSSTDVLVTPASEAVAQQVLSQPPSAGTTASGIPAIYLWLAAGGIVLVVISIIKKESSQ